MNKKHPSAWDPAIMLLNILVSVIGSIIGLELIARLGISTNTSIIGALFAIIIARIPLKIFQKYKDINTQNLVQTAMSGATFAASNVRKTGSGYSDVDRCFISGYHRCNHSL